MVEKDLSTCLVKKWKHSESYEVVLTNEEELVESSIEEEEDDVMETESAIWPLLKSAQVLQIAQTLKNKIKDYDPWMENSIKVTFVITEGLQLQSHFDELKRQL